MAAKPKKKVAKKAATKKVAKMSLAQTHPKLAEEADGWDAKLYSPGSAKKMPWKCSLGHWWETRISHRTGAGSGCPTCSGNVVKKGFNDLGTTNPLLSREALGWDVTQFSAGSGLRKKWRCAEGHEWEAVIKSRVIGRGCPVCANKQVLKGHNDLHKINPQLATEAYGWDTTTVLPHSNKKKQWLCEKGHKYNSSPGARMRGNGCPICTGKKVLAGFNDLASKFPSIALEAYEWDASKITSHSSKKAKWKCPFGHIYEMRVGNRTSLNQNCPVCSNQQVLEGYNDLVTLHPKVARSAYGWNAGQTLPFSHSKREWKCEEGHIWKAAVSSRTAGQGCPTCADSGYDVNSPAFLYLLKHEQWSLHKIGISNREKGRTELHESRGWKTIETRGPMDGLLAYEWEQSILKMLKKRGAEIGRKDIAGKFDGYTESWVADSFPVKSIKQLMQLVEEDEE